MTPPARAGRRTGRRLLAGLVVVAAATVAQAMPAAQAAPPPTAESIQAQEWWLKTLHVPDAWKTTRGAGVTVGLVDSGVDATHPDLRNALVPGKDFSGGHGAANGEAPVSGTFKPEHGTNMAGYIAGTGHGAGNRLGLRGVAPEAKLESISVLADAGGRYPPDELEQAIRWGVDHGATVLNLSLGGFTIDAAVRDAVRYAQQHQVVLVVATGNEGQPNGIDNLAALPGVVAVSGFVDDARNNYPLDQDSNSNGPETLEPDSTKASDYLGGVAVSGPFSTTDGALDLPGLTLVKDGSYSLTGGTSNATAIVSGVVALIRAAHPSWSAAQVVDALIHTAWRPAGFGYGTKHGFGIPDAAKAVAAPAPSVCENPLGSLVTDSAGIWPTIYKSKNTALTYTPTCGSPTSSSPPSSSAPASTGGSGPASPATSTPPDASAGSSSGGVPAWVWIVVAVVVIGGAAGLLLARRGRGGPPPGGGPGPGGTGPSGVGPGGPASGWPQPAPPPGWTAPGQQPPPGYQPPPPGGWTPPPGH